MLYKGGKESKKMNDSFTNKTENNLIRKGIEDFLLLFEKVFNEYVFKMDSLEHGLKDIDELSYKSHCSSYKCYKDIGSIYKINMHIGDYITPFDLDVPEDELTAAIQIFAEVIAKRDFSIDFKKYTPNDLMNLQDALCKLWNASEPGKSKGIFRLRDGFIDYERY